MFDPLAVSEYELSPDGYLRKAGMIVEVVSPLESPVDLDALGIGRKDANAEAASRYLRIAQTPLQTVVVRQP
jgi:hypothetical protein